MYLAAIEFPEIDPFLFRIGGFGLRWYALAYIAGLILGWRYVVSLMRKNALWPANTPPMKPDDAEDLLFGMALGVILGGRLGYVLFYKPGYYLSNPLEIVQMWDGGMSFHGGMLGAMLAIWLFARRGGRPVLQVGDAVACAVPIGLFFGRIANFINAELYGRETDVAWGMKFPIYCPPGGAEWCSTPGEWFYVGSEVLRHPSQLYEAALEGALLFIILWWLARRKFALKRPGTCIGVFLLGYGLARIFVENFRQPDSFIGEGGFVGFLGSLGLTQGMMLSLPMVIAGGAFILAARRKAAS